MSGDLDRPAPEPYVRIRSLSVDERPVCDTPPDPPDGIDEDRVPRWPRGLCRCGYASCSGGCRR